MTRPGGSLRVEAWPQIDQARWTEAMRPAAFLVSDKPASKWSAARRRLVVQAYGQWLRHLAERGALDPELPPEARVTEERLRAFVAELQARVTPVTVAMMVGCLKRMLDVLAPGRDNAMLQRVHRHLKRTAKPSRRKATRVVAATDLLSLGMKLMATCRDADTPAQVAVRYRDGLIIALLICCPIRLANLVAIEIGRQLTFDGRVWRLRFTAAETKTARPYDAELPESLTPRVQAWLEIWRPLLIDLTQTFAPDDGRSPYAGDALWIGRFGTPIGAAAIRRQVTVHTREAFGQHVWPHLFRDCAVTELADLAPEQLASVADLLGHSNLQTTARHYLQARGMLAHARVQEMIARRRRTSADRPEEQP